MPFTLPTLNFNYYELESIIDEKTVRIHHTLHHQTYVTNLNKEVSNNTNANLVSVLKDLNLISNPAIRNNAGGHYNHSLYWYILKPLDVSMMFVNIQNINLDDDQSVQSLAIIQKIIAQYDTIGNLREKMTQEGLKRFGSGWVWLCENNNKDLFITTTANQDNPIMNVTGIEQGRPIIGIDVWEHAYYLKYQNQRKLYLDAIWHLFDWNKIEEVYLTTNGLPAGALD